jgi:Uma2 family endonuclease
MGALPKSKMNADEYLRWCDAQETGRFELVQGEVVMMSPETIRHIEVKNEAWLAFRNALKDINSNCRAIGDGAGVQIDKNTVREPDIAVQCAPRDLDAVLLNDPVIVVEVVSPSSKRSDTGTKVAEYFRVASIQHYLIIDPYTATVIHHLRDAGGGDIHTRIFKRGLVELTPPGISVAVAGLLGNGLGEGEVL